MLFAPVRDFASDVDFKLLEMAYPYQQAPYNDYSNPGSPWSVDHQHQQPQTPILVGTPSNHSNLTISPPVYQQQLSPESPASILQHQPPPLSYHTPPTIHLEERVPPRPNQLRFESIDPSHFEQQRDEAVRSSSRPPTRASRGGGGNGGGDEVTSSTSPSSGGAGPSRVPHGRAHAAAAHPYRRQSQTGARTSPSRTDSGVMTRTGQAAAGRRSVSAVPSSATRRERADGTEILAERTAPRPSKGAPPPMVGFHKAAVPCPAVNVWRVSTTYNDSGEQRNHEAEAGAATSTAADSPAPASAEAPTAPLVAKSAPLGLARLKITTDMWFDNTSNKIVAVLELPGVKKEAVRLQLTVCPQTGVPALVVQSRTYSSVPDGVHAVKERRTGHCLRSINVPVGTKKEDVSAHMEDGLLTIRFPGLTPPPQPQDPHDIDIN